MAHPTSDVRIEVEEIDSEQDIVVRNLPIRVVEKRQLAHTVIGLKPMLPASERLQYLPGEYVDVLLRDGGDVHPRSPTRPVRTTAWSCRFATSPAARYRDKGKTL